MGQHGDRREIGHYRKPRAYGEKPHGIFWAHPPRHITAREVCPSAPRGALLRHRPFETSTQTKPPSAGHFCGPSNRGSKSGANRTTVQKNKACQPIGLTGFIWLREEDLNL